MKKVAFLFISFAVLTLSFSFYSHYKSGSGITNYYYFMGQKFYYQPKLDHVFIKFQDGYSQQQLQTSLERYAEIDLPNSVFDNNKAIIKLDHPMNDGAYMEFINKFKDNAEFESVGNVYTPLGYDDGKTFYAMSNEFIVQFKENYSQEMINSVNSSNNVEIVQHFDLTGGPTFLLKLKPEAELNAIDMANKYYEDGIANYAEPDFYCTNTLCDTTNDQYFWWQWAIRNLGTNVPTNPPGVIADCDMDVDSAWMISKGDTLIKICIIDTGVDTNHADIRPNLRLDLGWDYADNDPYPYDQGNHGTSCASIAAGVGNNTIGIAGIAYRCKIIPIRAIGGISAYHGYANSFIHAKNVGADVITNSWGQTGGASSLLYNAISDAARYGRGGKGCVITFASGNENGAMRFPAYIHPDIIVVGGLAPCNKRKSPTDGCSGETWGASYGSNLDVVAPCTRIYAATVGGGYTNSFNGTSSATPNAAGVCALLLSANPNLKRQEVEAYIYLTAEKVGEYNYDSLRLYGMWNQEMGYGRINSRLAMSMMLTNIDKVPPVIYHDKTLLSDSITGARTAIAIIRDNRKLATGSNAPRCYYRVNNGSFSFVNASQIAGDTFKFNIPGQITGSFVQYYFAAQDTMSTPNISTLPVGGSGINPPGTTPPTTFFSYRVGLYMIGISTKTPKICNNNSTIYDTILFTAPSNWLVTDVNVTLNISHRTDSDVDVYLYHSTQQCELTTDNGGSGDSYWDTIFDDSASTPITSGTAPFTGRFRPETPLNVFNNSSVNGLWILRMDDDAAGDFGTLDSWELAITYLRMQGTEPQTEIPTRFELYQNYPNPFNPLTKIRFDVPKQSHVKIILYDVLGREAATIIDKNMQPGAHTIDFNTANLSSGVYFYKMTASDFASIKKMVILK